MTTMTTTNHAAEEYCPLPTAVKKLSAWVSRFDRWMKIVDYTIATGDNSRFNVRVMPSKASKHHAYDYEAVIARHLGRERATCVDDMRSTIAAARAALKAR